MGTSKLKDIKPMSDNARLQQVYEGVSQFSLMSLFFVGGWESTENEGTAY